MTLYDMRLKECVELTEKVCKLNEEIARLKGERIILVSVLDETVRACATCFRVAGVKDGFGKRANEALAAAKEGK